MEAGLAAAVVAIWIFAVVMALSVAQARKADLLKATLNSAGFAAKDLATTPLLQLRNWSGNVELANAGKTLAELLGADARDGLRRYLTKICSSQPNVFASCFVLNRDGIMVVDVPSEDKYRIIYENLTGQDFAFRDYFRAAKRQGIEGGSRAIYISRVFRGVGDNLFKFAIAEPILDAQGKFVGVIATTVTTEATMGLVDPHDHSRQVALLAPRAYDSSEPGSGSDLGKYVVLFHPAYQHGIAAVEFPDTGKLNQQRDLLAGQQLEVPDPSFVIPADDDYRDPVSAVDKNYEGRWIAGFAPVGSTGFMVVVQQRFEDAVSLETSTFWRLALWSALASLVALAILGIVLLRWARSRSGDNGVGSV